jgi:hypothetical protein
LTAEADTKKLAPSKRQMSYEAEENCLQNLQFGADVDTEHGKVTYSALTE